MKQKIEKLDIGDMPIFGTNDTSDEDSQESGEVVAEIEIEEVDKRSDLTSPPAQQETNIPVFMLSLFQIADQAKIIHFQTLCHTEHLHFGLFYDEFIKLLDSLIEGIAGKYGTDKISFGHANIVLYDMVEAKPKFFDVINEVLRIVFYELFDRDKDSELYSIVDDMLILSNKVQYLLQMK